MKSKTTLIIIISSILFWCLAVELSAQLKVIPPPEDFSEDKYLIRNLKSVRSLINIGDYDRALSLLRSLSKKYGDDNNEIIAELKNIYRAKKDYPSLISIIKRELSSKADSFMAFSQLGEAYFLSDSLSVAKKYWNKAFDLAGMSESKYVILANYYLHYGFYEEAINVYRRAQKKLNMPHRFSSQLADIFLSQRNYIKAVTEYLNLLEDNWQESNYIPRQIMSIAKESDHPELIEQVIMQAVRDTPNLPILYTILGDINILNKNLSAAFDNYKRADILSGSKGRFLLEFAKTCFDKAEFEMAISAADYYMSKIRGTPSPQIRMIKAKSLAELGIYQPAIDILKYIEQNSKDLKSRISAGFTLAEIYADKLDDQKAARDKFSQIAANKRYPLYAHKAKMRLADIHIKLAEFPKASSILNELSKIKKNSDLAERAAFMKAEVDFFTHDFDNARKGYENLIKRYPSGYYVNDCLDRLGFLDAANDTVAIRVAEAARCYYIGLIDSAIALLETAAASDNSDADEYVMFSLAYYYAAAGMWDKAAAKYEDYNLTFPEGLYIDRSFYLLAKLYLEKLGQPEKADKLFKKILADFPSSPLIEKARLFLNRIKAS